MVAADLRRADAGWRHRLSDDRSGSWAKIVLNYLRKFGKPVQIPEDLPPERIHEAMQLLEQATTMNRPFAGDDDFRRALGLGPRTTP